MYIGQSKSEIDKSAVVQEDSVQQDQQNGILA